MNMGSGECTIIETCSDAEIGCSGSQFFFIEETPKIMGKAKGKHL